MNAHKGGSSLKPPAGRLKVESTKKVEGGRPPLPPVLQYCEERVNMLVVAFGHMADPHPHSLKRGNNRKLSKIHIKFQHDLCTQTIPGARIHHMRTRTHTRTRARARH